MRNRWDDEDYEVETQTLTGEFSELESFFDEGLISEVLYTVKSGKEATVYCCQAGPYTGRNLVAAKVYRSRQNRNFKNDSMYQEHRMVHNTHEKRAVQNKSRKGREFQAAMWTGAEFETLKQLHRVGADVPEPYAQNGNAILLEYAGDETDAAPVLNSVNLEPEEAQVLFDQLMVNIELWLKHNYIHADLSAYNILYWEGRLKIIDFPQAVDPRFNSNAQLLLNRDLDNVCRYFARQGIEADSRQIAANLWQRFRRSHL